MTKRLRLRWAGPWSSTARRNARRSCVPYAASIAASCSYTVDRSTRLAGARHSAALFRQGGKATLPLNQRGRRERRSGLTCALPGAAAELVEDNLVLNLRHEVVVERQDARLAAGGDLRVAEGLGDAGLRGGRSGRQARRNEKMRVG